MHEAFFVHGIQGDELGADGGRVGIEAQSVDKKFDSCFGVCDFWKLGCYHLYPDLFVSRDVLWGVSSRGGSLFSLPAVPDICDLRPWCCLGDK